MCRSALPPERIDPAFFLGYSCVLCAKPLQVSEFGLKKMLEAGGGNTVCNHCGASVVDLLNESPPKHGATFNFLPHAVDAIEQQTGAPATEMFPTAKIEFTD